MAGPITIAYFSDVLCVWAYVAQVRVDEVKARFGADVRIDYRFCSVFGDARGKIATGWQDRGGAEGYGKHVLAVAKRFPHVSVRPDIWVATQPASSASPHLFLSALREHEGTGERFERVMWAFRRAFFEAGRDIGRWDVQQEIGRSEGVDMGAMEQSILTGTAFARLQADYQEAEKLRVEGSPTFVLNEGRQKLYGNVGFRVIEANINELLREPAPDQLSWC
jgi:predicted DsbA family dithiol-disulfide isomerase